MPVELYDKDGNAVELPVDKVEDIASLQEKAKKVDELEPLVKPDIRNMRKIMDDQGARIKEMTAKLKEHGEDVGEADKITAETVAKVAMDTAVKLEAEKTEKRRQVLIDQLSGGDETKKKVLEEKWGIVSGGKQITDTEEMQRLMDDAVYLSKKTSEKSGHIPFSEMSGGGSPAGAPQRGDASGDKATAVSNLEAMGYKFRTDKSKLVK